MMSFVTKRAMVLWASAVALAGCGAVTELRAPSVDGAAAAPDAITSEGGAMVCPSSERLSTARRIAWSTCNNPNREEGCVVSTDGQRVCACNAGDQAQEQCGFALVNFIGSTAVPSRALCDSRTGMCLCTIGGVGCACRSSAPNAGCAIRTGRNCCWNESL